MGVAALILMFGAFIVGSSAGPRAWRSAIDGLMVGGAIVVVVGLAQLFGLTGDGGRPTSTLGNAGFLGAFLCLVVPVSAALALTDRRARPWFGLLLGGAIVLLAGTQTRGAWIGAAGGLGLVLAGQLRRPRPAATIVVGVALAVGAVVALALPVQGVRGAGSFDLSQGTARGRVDTWVVALRAVDDRPLLGWGPEGLRRGFAEHMDAGWVDRYRLEQLPDRAHNRFLDVAASTGLVGLLADFALVALAVATCRRALRAAGDTSERMLFLGLIGGLFAWLVQGQALFDTFETALVVWLLVGTLAAVASELAPVGRPAATVLGAAAVLVVAVGVVGVASDRRVQSASGRAPKVAYLRLESAALLRPRSLDAYLLAGAVATNGTDVAVMQRAHMLLEGWDDDEVRFADARLLVRLGLVTGDPNYRSRAVELLRSVLERRPNDVRVLSLLERLGAN